MRILYFATLSHLYVSADVEREREREREREKERGREGGLLVVGNIDCDSFGTAYNPKFCHTTILIPPWGW